MYYDNIPIDYSVEEEILSCVPQVSILGPLLFGIFLCDLHISFENNYFTNYADDATPDVIGNNLEEAVSKRSKKKKRTGVTFDNKLKFEKHKYNLPEN